MKIGYVLSGRKRGRVQLRYATEMGPWAIERMVAGRYEWRDAAHRSASAKKRKRWEELRTWDPGVT